jgi:sugar-specific transcriptional regulator TrmB
MNTKILQEIGLTESEIRVYLALLKLGQTTAGKIVDEAKVTRSKIYDILERLKNKGLVSYIIKESTKYFSATNPNNLLKYLEEKEEKIQEEKQSIKEIIPELLNQHLSQKDKIAEVFIGINGMKNAFNVLIEEFGSKEPYYAFGAGKGENVEQIQIFFSQLHLKRKEKKVKSFIIFNESSRGLFKEQEKSRLVEAKYIKQSTPTAINIYKNYTLIAILTKEPITFLINNKETAESFKEYFKIMWKLAKK